VFTGKQGWSVLFPSNFKLFIRNSKWMFKNNKNVVKNAVKTFGKRLKGFVVAFVFLFKKSSKVLSV